MNTTHTTPPPTSPRYPTGGVVRAVAAMVVLLVLVVGLPVVLAVLAPISLPTRFPSPAQVGAALTTPDHGELLIGALALVAWVAWVVFALSTLVEILATVRGLPAPRLPGLALPQGVAAALVAAAAVMLTTTPASPARAATTPTTTATTATPLRSPASLAVAGPVAPTAARHTDNPIAKPVSDAPARAYPTITVHRGDTLWELAEHHLGDGTRFREIAELNYHHTQPDGARLTDAHWIYPGWVLRLPHDATHLPRHNNDRPGRAASSGDATPTPPHVDARSTERAAPGHDDSRDTHGPRTEHREYVVRAGDTLWDIARTRLGDPTRYRELFRLNAGRPQPDGHALRDPALILPGWHLRFPTQDDGQHHHTAGDRHPHRPAPASPAQSTTVTDGDEHLNSPTAPATQSTPVAEPTTPAVPVAPTRTEPDLPAVGLAPPTLSPPQIPHPATEADVDLDDDAPLPVGALTLGLTGLAAAGIITDLARRRRHQQRRRPFGTHIAMPENGSPAHATERLVRSGVDTPTLQLLRAALTRLATRHCQRGLLPPRIALILISPDQIELHLQQPDALEPAVMAPFTPAGDDTWVATRAQLLRDDGDGDASDTPEADGEDPGTSQWCYPALITLGVTDNAVVLANLEAAGTLTITPSPDSDASDPEEAGSGLALAVLRAIAFETVTSPLTTACTLSVTDDLADLATVSDPSRIRTQPPAAMAAGLHARTSGASQAADVLTARAADNPDTGGVDVYLATTVADGLHADAWSGCVTVLATDTTTTGGWSMHLGRDRARLQPHGLDLRPQHLEPDTYQNLIDLLAITARPATAPGPESALTPASDHPAQAPEPISAPTPVPVTTNAAAAPASSVTAHPRLRVLGPVRIEGADSRHDNRRRRLTELIAYLALHPDAPAAALDDILWNGRRVTRETRNSLIYRARSWLGDAPDGTPYLLYTSSTTSYRLHPDLTCDWYDFQHHQHAAAATNDTDQKITELQAALDLVLDRPFLGVDPANYQWAEHDTQTMISAIVDTAHQLATLRLYAGDTRGAQDAAAHGLFVDPVNEQLYRDALTAAQTRSDIEECQRLEHQLRARLDDFDPDIDLEPETIDLLCAIRDRQ